MATAELAITDPQAAPSTGSWFDRAALSMIRDPRDLPFVRLMVSSSLVLMPFAATLLLWRGFPWWLGVVYLAVNFLGFLDRYILMLHNTSHRVLFKTRYDWLNQYIPVVLGPLFGETPHTYFVHHIGMHHPENNLEDDLSSTMPYKRDNPLHFAFYFLRFFIAIVPEMTVYMRRKGRPRFIYLMFMGELGFYAAVALLSWWHWQGALFVLIIPFVSVRFLMMAGNWGQHAFIDASDPANPHKNSITCINARYNRRCFNDGYHIGHHVKANRHWTEMPGDLLRNRERYAADGALVFQGIDFFVVWLLLMLRRYDALARRVVHLGGPERTHAETVALLRQRVMPVVRA